MEEVFKDPVPFTKGINIREMLTKGGTEFQIDMDFKKQQSSVLLNADDDLFPDIGDEDSDTEDVMKLIEENTAKKLIPVPEYNSFEELAKSMIDCDSRGYVKLLILEEGDGPLVPVDSEVTVHYAAYWEKASIPFDSSLTMNSGERVRLRLGQGKLIPGLEVGLTTVKGPTARFLLLLQPAAAWGERGVPPRIQPQPALFVVCLYGVRDLQAAVRFNDLPREEQEKFEVTSRTVKSIHEDAKNMCDRNRYDKAIRNYQQSITILNVSRPQNPDEENEVKNLKIKAFINLCVCYSKLNKPKYILRMLESLDYVTDVEKHCKALYYYGKAYDLQGKTELAIEYYKKALEIEPKNTGIGKALEKIHNDLKISKKNEKDMWQSAFKTEKRKKFDVDADFEESVKEMFKDLQQSKEFAKFNLPNGLNNDEVDYVKHLAQEFANMVVLEEGEGRAKKVAIVKKTI